jgi:cytidine deaminase
MDCGKRKMKKSHGHKSDREELFETLYDVASEVQKHAYAPYSNYKVGCAIVSASGTVFGGCNVENASYGATICAERSAILQMVAAGESTPIACVILTDGDPAPPCGICRQVLGEFSEDMVIWLVGKGRDEGRAGTVRDQGRAGKSRKDRVIIEQTLADLLPGAFRADFLPGRGGRTSTAKRTNVSAAAQKTSKKK